MNPIGNAATLLLFGRWARVASVVGAYLMTAPAFADSKQSTTHAMQWEEGQNIHIANQGGAINRHANFKIEVEVFSSQRVIVTDSGTRSEHNLFSSYSTDEATTWSNSWDGTWSLTGEVMRLQLALRSRQCTHDKKSSDAAPQTLPCGRVSKELALACTLGQVTTEDPSGPPPGRATIPVWTCSPSTPAALADTPPRWVLGKAACVKILAGPNGSRYQKCAAP